jgi:hypothetical protein
MADYTTRYFVDARGSYLGGYAGGDEKPFGDASEIAEPPKDYRDVWSFALGRWIPYDPPVTEKRKQAYEAELGGVGDQFDAIYKGLLVLVPALVKSGAIPPEVAAALLPDASAPVDTPPGWLGKLAEIKARYPKEGK